MGLWFVPPPCARYYAMLGFVAGVPNTGLVQRITDDAWASEPGEHFKFWSVVSGMLACR